MESNRTALKRRLLQFQPRTIFFSCFKSADTYIRKKTPRQVLVPEERVLLERKDEKRAKTVSEEIVRNRHVISGIVPCVKITNLYRDANSATDVCSEALRMASPVKSQRKVVEKDQLLY